MATQPVVTLDLKKVTELQNSNLKVLEEAKACTIVDNDDFLIAGSQLDDIAKRKKVIKEFFEKPKKNAYELHRWITSQEGVAIAPLERAEALLKSARLEYRAQKDRDARAREEEERKKAKEVEDALAIEQAAQLHAIGEHEAAETVIERQAAAPPPPVIVQSDVPKEKGHSFKKVFKYRISDASLIKREFLIPNASAIQAMVTKLGLDAMNVVGGIEVTEGEVELVREKK